MISIAALVTLLRPLYLTSVYLLVWFRTIAHSV